MVEEQTRRVVVGGVEVVVEESGAGRPALVLHGGGGPGTVTSLARHLRRGFRALVPTHPGWDGTERPDDLATVGDLADLYLRLLDDEGLTDVLVVGSSVGGWIAAEMAARDGAGELPVAAGSRRVGALVLVDAVGIAVDGEPITDFFALDARGVAEHVWHEPDRFFVEPSALTEAQRATLASNAAALRTYAGDPYMHDPTLAGRLAGVRVPAAVLWGDDDGIVGTGYGRAFAQALPAGTFHLVPDAGHLPHVEQPGPTFAYLDEFLAVV